MFLRNQDTLFTHYIFFSCMRDHVLFPHLLSLIFTFHCSSETASIRLIIQANDQVLFFPNLPFRLLFQLVVKLVDTCCRRGNCHVDVPYIHCRGGMMGSVETTVPIIHFRFFHYHKDSTNEGNFCVSFDVCCHVYPLGFNYWYADVFMIYESIF